LKIVTGFRKMAIKNIFIYETHEICMNNFCKCFKKNSFFLCEIPITSPTSKVRVKRITINQGKEEIQPIAVRKEKISTNDYIEWQISYLNDGSLIEFGYLLKNLYENNIITNTEICDIIKKFKGSKTFEEEYSIGRELNKKYLDFEVLYEKTPIFRLKSKNEIFMDIILRHKQRAVGYQPMIYIYIPVNKVNSSSPLIDRVAYSKETIYWKPEKEHILDLLKAFFMASQKHRSDILNIIKDKLKISCD